MATSVFIEAGVLSRGHFQFCDRARRGRERDPSTGAVVNHDVLAGLAIEQIKDVNKIMWQDVQNWKEHVGMFTAVAEQYAVKVPSHGFLFPRFVVRAHTHEYFLGGTSGHWAPSHASHLAQPSKPNLDKTSKN